MIQRFFFRLLKKQQPESELTREVRVAENPLAPTGQTICPYCKAGLEKMPQRKKKCPECGNFIYVRTLPQNRVRVLCTEKLAAAIDAEWEKLNERDMIVQDLASAGIGEQELDDTLRSGLGLYDAAWGLLNERIQTLMGRDDFQAMKMVYRTMAMVADKRGAPFQHLLAESHRCELYHWRRDGYIKEVQILADGRACPACAVQNGKVFTIDRAIRESPIPCLDCEGKLYSGRTGWCRCCYLPVVDF